jgi:hypothetical protein
MALYAMLCEMTERPKNNPATKGRSTREPARDRPRIGGPRAIADLMPQIGGAAFRRFGFVQSSIVTRWAEIVDPRHADISAPESIRFPAGKKADGTLVLTVLSGYAPMIQHVLPEIIDRVNRFFGYAAIARVTIKQGEVVARKPERRPPPANLKPVPVELGDSLRDIGDPELRAVLEAMAQGLANAAPIGKIS